MSNSCRNSFHTSDVNLESRSDPISVGRPWNFHTSLAKAIAKSGAVLQVFGNGMKCAILVNRSTTTQSWSHSSDSSSSVMKSIAIDCHGAYGSSKGEVSPYGRWWTSLFCWHSGQLLTKSVIRSFIFGHQKFLRTSSIVLSWPMCPSTLVSCSDRSIWSISPSGTHSMPFL